MIEYFFAFVLLAIVASQIVSISINKHGADLADMIREVESEGETMQAKILALHNVQSYEDIEEEFKNLESNAIVAFLYFIKAL